MAETTLDLRTLPREKAYTDIREQITTVLDGIRDPIAAMATISSLVHHAFGFLWTGFYRVVAPGKLRVGPYQGTIGCLEIEFGRGVCGVAAESGEAIIVDDVLTHANHITCDPRARSEIAIPVFDGNGGLVAVFDVDSDQPANFGEVDRAGLESILAWFANDGGGDR